MINVEGEEKPVYVEVDLSTVPPGTTLQEPEDLKSFRLVVRSAEHASVAPEELLRLAGSRADAPDWRQQFEAMVEYARAEGWVREDGAIRAHVEEA